MKTKLQTLFGIGILILLSPIFYFPSTIKTILTLVAGALIIYLTWRIRSQYKTVQLKLRRYEETHLIQ